MCDLLIAEHIRVRNSRAKPASPTVIQKDEGSFEVIGQVASGQRIFVSGEETAAQQHSVQSPLQA